MTFLSLFSSFKRCSEKSKESLDKIKIKLERQ